MRFRFSAHAEQAAKNRGIPRVVLEFVLGAPEEIVEYGPGKKIFQSRCVFDDGRHFLVRVVVNVTVDPAVVITAYRTSKVQKYRRST